MKRYSLHEPLDNRLARYEKFDIERAIYFLEAGLIDDAILYIDMALWKARLRR